MWLIFPSASSIFKSVAFRGLKLIKTDEKLTKLALDMGARPDVRGAATERITDEGRLARIVEELWSYEPINAAHKKCRAEIFASALPRISSPDAVITVKAAIMRSKYFPPELQESLFPFIRRTKDFDCMMKLFRHETRISAPLSDEKRLDEIRSDIAALRELGVSKSELADEATPKAVRELVPELVDEETIRARADDLYFMDELRGAVPDELVIRAMEGDSRRDKVLYRYRIIDGVTYKSECDFGNHEYVFERVETEENYEDCQHPMSRTYYRCRLCGKRKVEYDDGWGRKSTHELKGTYEVKEEE